MFDTINAVEATCITRGYTGDVVCSVGGEFVSRGKETDFGDHILGEGIVTVLPTTESTGVKSYFCTLCGKLIKTEVIPKLDKPVNEHTHVFSEEWSSDNFSHWHECVANDAISGKADHNWDEGEYVTATCTSAGTVKYTCLTCDFSELRDENGGHRWSDWYYDNSAHYKVCTG